MIHKLQEIDEKIIELKIIQYHKGLTQDQKNDLQYLREEASRLINNIDLNAHTS